MRTYSLLSQTPIVYGIMTNFKDWIFTKYSFLDEARFMMKETREYNPFQISQVYQVMKKDDETGVDDLNEQELVKVVKII